jgi:hypothetical protein
VIQGVALNTGVLPFSKGRALHKRRNNFEFSKSIKSNNSNYEPIIGCKHPIISSGDTPIGSTERAPDKRKI